MDVMGEKGFVDGVDVMDGLGILFMEWMWWMG